ncbi:MAG TPA: hypothetical protein VFG48_11160, partial [Xanthomonadales bacterium]|nr:hypothetical protein [Xanthomonadales bacterium]
AAGTGYGLLLEEGGAALEYVGSARSGLAEGVGAMIFRSPAETGALYFEGELQRGVPDGVVSVEEPGHKGRVRMYRAGQDIGAASDAQWRRVQF